MKASRTILAFALLLLVLLWRMLGSPVMPSHWQALGTPLWQARMLWPARVARVLCCWPLLGGAAAEPQQADMLSVYDAQADALVTMELEEYVRAVVAAEMPASYHIEALKAQAVAARTRAVAQARAFGGKGCDRCAGADICTDSAHCQGYATAQSCAARWGETAGAYSARIASAVEMTAGKLLTYEGRPITVLYHAMSGGHTEDAQAVFAQSVPYLVGVDSAGEESLRGCYEDARFSLEEAASLLRAVWPEVTAESLRGGLSVSTHTATGRVETLLLGTRTIDATELRRALGLRSTWFTLSCEGDTLTFHQRGYGHGVGMSQAGANAMAAGGADYETILAHYYQGTALTELG